MIRVLVVGAEDDTLAVKIHDLGLFESIICTDCNCEGIKAMLGKRMFQTHIKWRSLYLDTAQKLVPRNMTEVIFTFKGGGKFICFIDCRTSTAL
ncbi:hypothetical protein OROMI_017714 [Orobanche minor]